MDSAEGPEGGECRGIVGGKEGREVFVGRVGETLDNEHLVSIGLMG